MEAKGEFNVGRGALLPLDGRAHSMFEVGGLKLGDRVLVTVHRARNPEHNSLAHVVFTRIGQAMSHSMEVVKLWLKWETGYVDIVRLPNGKSIPNPRSLKFESMGQDEFQAWWDEALEVIKEKALPKLSQQEFEQIRDIIVGKRAA